MFDSMVREVFVGCGKHRGGVVTEKLICDRYGPLRLESLCDTDGEGRLYSMDKLVRDKDKEVRDKEVRDKEVRTRR